MMDIGRVWNESSGSDDSLNKLMQRENLRRIHSKLPLKKLKDNLFIGLVLAAVITGLYLVLYLFFQIWLVRFALIVATIFNIIVGLETVKLYKSINVNISMSRSVKEGLEANYLGFQSWWRIQEKLSLFVYPIAIIAGFVLGGIEGSGKSMETFLFLPKVLPLLAGSLLLLVPLCYIGARWLYTYTYGKHLKKIKSMIDELDNDGK